MYKLYVSTDFGLDYSVLESNASRGTLLEKVGPYEATNCRWYIEDESGALVDYCELFKKTLAAMLKLGKGIAFATDDRILSRLLGDHRIPVISPGEDPFQFLGGFDRASVLH